MSRRQSAFFKTCSSRIPPGAQVCLRRQGFSVLVVPWPLHVENYDDAVRMCEPWTMPTQTDIFQTMASCKVIQDDQEDLDPDEAGENGEATA